MPAHDRCGSGPPLVLIHGLGSHRQVWSPVIAAVARHREVITIDLPGFGDSPMWPTPTGPREAGSVDHLAGLVAEFLGELGLDRPEVAGNSLGGGIALELGRRGLVSAVTAFAPVGFWGPAGLRWCRTAVGAARFASVALAPVLPGLLRTRAGRTALCSVFYGHPSRVPAEDCLAGARALAAAPGFAAAHAALGSWQFRATAPPPTGRGAGRSTGLERIPVTVAWGSRDAVLTCRTQAARAREALPAARHVVLDGCGHLPFADDPERCAELLTLRQ
ncbi:alpha/beta fold hydrolase [Actinoplanes sp. NPDC051494]|uniref:alpha/beta fold hydrolase n=1 Tax=Actinoplanes sp. NPDC051494 TaxID=3363907 RepID=UPI0037952AC3